MGLIERVRRYAAQHSLWQRGARVIAAVSGGSDSVALLFLLSDLAASGDLELTGLAHLHHHIRRDGADEDAAFCRALADRLGLPACIAGADVPADARREGLSIEVAGRAARQRFYLDALAALQGTHVATAHTRDDQAETVMLRLTRGAGAAGLAGIAPRRDHLVRPLLEITRHELRQYLHERGERWREDATNADRSIPRNLVRHEVLPRLREINARADIALTRAAETLRADAQFLEAHANDAFVRLVRTDAGGGAVRVDAEGLARLPAALAWRVALRALETARPGRSYGLEDAQLVCAAAAGRSVSSLQGVEMERSGADVVLTIRQSGSQAVRQSGGSKEGGSEDPLLPATFELPLDVPGTVCLPRGGWAVSADGPMPREEASARGEPVEAGARAMVDAGTVIGGLIVRPRRPGDRLHPLGAPGRKKVQDVFVDRKVPRDERDSVPIVTDKMGKIVWVAGQVLAEGFRVTPLTTTVVVLTLRRQ